MVDHTPPVNYIERTRRYYKALGYETPYRWASFNSVPFTHPGKPLVQSTVGIVTTAAPFDSSKGDQGPGAPYNAAAKFYSVYRLPIQPSPDLRISHVAIDRVHTTAEDPGSYLPIDALRCAAEQGKIAGIGQHVVGLPTNRSQKHTIEVDCPAVVSYMLQDEIDIAILVPNCPVCHQSVSLAARALEEAGIVTVVLGCAKDIVEHVGVPRLLFNDFPLGNAAGIPGDVACQQGIITAALDLAETADAPRTSMQSMYQWPGKSHWKTDYSNPDKLSAEEIRRKREDFDAAKNAANVVRSS